MITRKQILKSIGNPNLDLQKGNGYFYFVYDSGDKYEEESIMVNTINVLSLDQWKGIGEDFLKEVAESL